MKNALLATAAGTGSAGTIRENSKKNKSPIGSSFKKGGRGEEAAAALVLWGHKLTSKIAPFPVDLEKFLLSEG